MVRALGFARTIHEVSHPRISVEHLTSDPWGEMLRLDAWADLGGKGTKHSALRYFNLPERRAKDLQFTG